MNQSRTLSRRNEIIINTNFFIIFDRIYDDNMQKKRTIKNMKKLLDSILPHYFFAANDRACCGWPPK